MEPRPSDSHSSDPKHVRPSFDSTCFQCAQAFDQLVRPHMDAMRRCALRILKSSDLAEDAVQEVLMRIWTQGWLPEDARPVLLSLTDRTARHLRRSQQRRCQHEQQPCPECSSRTPLDSAMESEFEQILDRGMKSLDHQHREILELAQGRQYDYQAMAERLSVPLGTVRSRLSRARAALDRKLAPLDTQSG